MHRAGENLLGLPASGFASVADSSHREVLRATAVLGGSQVLIILLSAVRAAKTLARTALSRIIRTCDPPSTAVALRTSLCEESATDANPEAGRPSKFSPARCILGEGPAGSARSAGSTHPLSHAVSQHA